MLNKNDDFFEEIDSEIKAYLLGFYLGDGSLSMPNSNRIRYSFRISVSEKDKYIIDLFREYISPNSKISYTKPKEIIIGNKKYLQNGQFKIDINSKRLCLSIDKLGYGTNKTYTEKYLPNIDKVLMSHFLRGYFDADGVCVTGEYERNDRNTTLKRVKTTFCITSKDNIILEDIRNFLLFKLKIDIKIYYDSNRKVYNLKSSHKSYLISLYHYFYDFANFYLQRKKDSFSLVMLTPREFRELKSSKPRNA